MRHGILILFITGVTAFAQGDDAAKKELKLFQGKWQATFAQSFDGAEQTEAEIMFTQLEVEDDKFTMKTGSLTVKGTMVIDPSKKPKTIDIYFGDNKDNMIKGIYEIKGDKGDMRKSCFAGPGKDRPTEFVKGKGYQYLEWRSDK